jgi:hypothetical protein
LEPNLKSVSFDLEPTTSESTPSFGRGKKAEDSTKQISANKSRAAFKSAPFMGCLKCKGDHWIFQCDKATAQEKIDLRKAYSEAQKNKSDSVVDLESSSKGKSSSKGSSSGSKSEEKSIGAILQLRPGLVEGLLFGKFRMQVLLDWGADETCISMRHVNRLLAVGARVALKYLHVPYKLGLAFGQESTMVSQTACFDLTLPTHVGKMELRSIRAAVIHDDDLLDLILGRKVALDLVGLDLNKQLHELSLANPVIDCYKDAPHQKGRISMVVSYRFKRDLVFSFKPRISTLVKSLVEVVPISPAAAAAAATTPSLKASSTFPLKKAKFEPLGSVLDLLDSEDELCLPLEVLVGGVSFPHVGVEEQAIRPNSIFPPLGGDLHQSAYFSSPAFEVLQLHKPALVFDPLACAFEAHQHALPSQSSQVSLMDLMTFYALSTCAFAFFHLLSFIFLCLTLVVCIFPLPPHPILFPFVTAHF